MFKSMGGLQIVYVSGRYDAERFNEDSSKQEKMVSFGAHARGLL